MGTATLRRGEHTPDKPVVLPDDKRLFVGLRAGGVALLAVSLVVGLETGSSHPVVAGLIAAVLLLVGARVLRSRKPDHASGHQPRGLFWADLVIALGTIGYLAQSNPSGATLALILAGGVAGWCGAGLLRDGIARIVQPRAVVRFVLLLVATAGTIAYFLYATGLGWRPAWAAHLLIINGVSGLIGLLVGLASLRFNGRSQRRAGTGRTN